MRLNKKQNLKGMSTIDSGEDRYRALAEKEKISTSRPAKKGGIRSGAVMRVQVQAYDSPRSLKKEKGNQRQGIEFGRKAG